MTSSTFDTNRSKRSGAAQGEKPPLISVALVLDVLRRWWMIVIPAGLCAGAVAASVVYLNFEPMYVARALLWMDPESSYLVAPVAGQNRHFVSNQIGLIRSSLVLGPAVSQPEIADLPEIAQASEPINALRSRVNVTTAFGREHYYLTGTSANPAHAAAIANGVARSYFTLVGEYQSGREKRLIELLERERENSQREVNRLRDTVRQMTIDQTGRDPFARHPYGDGTPHFPLSSIHGQMTSLHVEQTVLRAQITALEEYMAENPSGVSEAMIDRYIEEDNRVRQWLASIEQNQALLQEIKRRSVQGEESPRYAALEQSIQMEQEMLEEYRKDQREPAREILAARTGRPQQQQLAALKGQLKDQGIRQTALTGAFREELEKLQQFSGTDLTLQMRRAELARAQGVLDRIAQRTFELRTEQRAPQRVDLIEDAAIPARPIENLPLKKLGLAFAIAFGCPYALALLWDLRLRHVMSADQLQEQTHLPVVGEIASLPIDAGGSRYFGSRRAGRNVRLFEESVEALRTCLVLTKSLGESQILAITSAATQEGKTTLAAQLAISLARSTDQLTLLIDGDMRAPNIHEIFDIENEQGLAQVLGDEIPLAEAIVTSWDERLHLLPAGQLKGNPHKLVGNEGMKKFLEEARRSYRYVVLDTPPVLAAGESLVMSAAADATLVCTRRDVSRQDQVGKAYGRLNAAGANVVGCVFSGVPLSHYKYRYGGYYYGEEQKV